MKLYEILIPLYTNKGIAFEKEVVEDFFLKVSDLLGGITILGEAAIVVGAWRGKDGTLFTDSSIPIRVAVSVPQELREVLALARTTFDQEAIFAFKISDEVIIHTASAD